MHVIRLVAANVKRLKAVDIRPNRHMTVIGGDNAQGKTSLLDTFFWALAGKKAIPEKPVREGEERAEIELELSNGLKVRRVVRPNRNTELHVYSGEGFRAAEPQEILSRIVGELAFDPLEFATKAP